MEQSAGFLADFGPMDVYRIITYFAVSIGYWHIFKKCGVKKFWAFVPIARDYHLSICADREKEGRTLAIIAGIFYALMLAALIFHNNALVLLFLIIPVAGIYIALIINNIKIYLGLIKVFERKKIWILLFIFLEGPTALIWGLSSKFVPSKVFEDYNKNEAAKVLGKELAAIDEGLTVNINKRTAIDFFKRKTLLKDIHM